MRTAENALFLYRPNAAVHPALVPRLEDRVDECGLPDRARRDRPQHLNPAGRPTICRSLLRTAILTAIISPKLGGLIADCQRSAAALGALDKILDPSAWEEAGMLACRSLKAPLDERPVTVAEFTAKFDALIKVTEDDSEFYIPRTLAADIRALIGEDER
jgi:hypothetical protein